jgi:asparagine synthase (glutamine-hydrolysing)
MPMMKGANDIALRFFFGYRLTDTNDPFYSHLLRWHNTSRIKTFFSEDMTSQLGNYDSRELLYAGLPVGFKDWTDLGKAQYLESSIFMSGYLLSSQGDRMMMANSVEGRYPFLDHRVIEFCNKLPDNFKLNGLNEKFLLKKMSEGIIPESIRKRSKQPYRAPLPGNFIDVKRSQYAADILSQDTLKSFGLFDPKKVSNLVTKMYSQKDIQEVDQMAIIGIISTQLLYKMFIAEPVEGNLTYLNNLRVINEV